MISFSAVNIAEEVCCVAAAFKQQRALFLLAVVWTDRAAWAELARVGEKPEAWYRIRTVGLHAWRTEEEALTSDGWARTLKNDKILTLNRLSTIASTVVV